MKDGFTRTDGTISTFDELEARIRAEVAAAKAEGWRIEKGIYYVPRSGCHGPCGCPLAACVRNGGTGPFDGMSIGELSYRAFVRDAAAELLGVSRSQSVAIVNGVDGVGGGDVEFYKLGARLRDLLDES